MADDTSKTASDVLMKQLIRMGIQIHVDQKDMDKNLNPALRALTRKLNQLSKDSLMEKEGIFGKNFFTDKVKAFTGFDLTLVKATSNMIAMGRASKEMNADNQQFYNTLNPVAKLMVDMVGVFRKKRDAEKEAGEAAKKAREQEGTLDDQAKKLELLNNLSHSTEGIAGNLGVLGEETASVGGGFMEMIKGIDSATVAMEIFETVATLGLALVVAAVAAIATGFYKIAMQAVTARDEIKKFDKLFGGVGAQGIAQIGTQLQVLNNELWGLGMSLEAVNAVALSATESGLNFSRAIDSKLVGSVLTLAGATGETAANIGTLYTELLKTTQIDVSSLTKMGDGLIQMNQYIKSTKTLGQISFSQLSESIKSSANALGIATAAGKTFTDRMIKDLTTLTTLASTLTMSVSAMNDLFENAGNMILNQESGFRTLLAISGGANVNQMLTNQFDKTDAMLKGIDYLQKLNNSFGKNIAITAQVAQQQLGISKDMAIKMINMRQDAIADMRKAAEEMSSMQTKTAKDAFEKVNSDLSSAWNRIKTMFVVFFQNAFGNNSGIQGLLSKVESFLGKLRGYMGAQNGPGGWLDKFRTALGKMAEWLTDKLDPLLTWLNKKLDDFSKPGAKNPLVQIWENLVRALENASMAIGFKIGQGMAKGVIQLHPVVMAYNKASDWWKNRKGNKNQPVAEDYRILQNSALQKKADIFGAQANDASTRRDELNKWNPETVTYGKMSKDGPSGFMTVGQKQDQLDREKKEAEAAQAALQQAIAANTEDMAKNIRIIAKQPEQHITPPKGPGPVPTSGNAAYGRNR